jgi:CTP synthase
MQMAIVEYARNVCNIKGAASEEFDPDAEEKVIHLMDTQKDIKDKGATMRLGAYPCVLKEGTLAHKIYGQSEISERHRHRFEVNNSYRKQFESRNMVLSGLSPDGNLVEMIELNSHPFFVACQFHPEFKSRPRDPHPLFTAFIKASLSEQQKG